MLYLDFSEDRKHNTFDPGSWFDAYYEQSWFDDKIVCDIACKIDDLKHEWADYFTSETFGKCSGKEISAGAKTVIAAYLGLFTDKKYPLSWLGENCFEMLGSIDIKSDIIFVANSMPNLWEWKCSFKSVQTGRVINSYETYIEEYE